MMMMMMTTVNCGGRGRGRRTPPGRTAATTKSRGHPPPPPPWIPSPSFAFGGLPYITLASCNNEENPCGRGSVNTYPSTRPDIYQTLLPPKKQLRHRDSVHVPVTRQTDTTSRTLGPRIVRVLVCPKKGGKSSLSVRWGAAIPRTREREKQKRSRKSGAPRIPRKGGGWGGDIRNRQGVVSTRGNPLLLV